ncbi:hypothetical protein QYE76_013101 [Lolium multiflorum]|uniref:Transposase (putative) gypsy type domain-containing protein n=1 Tax=Lolium multiflorum TaxID=4521 RepID=A0AAD8U395_LOLMU|nr:hypothetical protein QYE76_013101 [Lolium multiflorum]
MPPRPKLTRPNTPDSMATQDLGKLEWERSKISPQDTNLLKKLGLNKKKNALLFPSEESYPTPPIEYRFSFVDHLIRGLSAPIHDFLPGLLFVYGLQLHHLTPNSILHISIFITLCECFLGVQPNWALWKRIFLVRRNGSSNIAYNIGGVVICVRPDVEYFDVKFPDSVQGWRRKWIRVQPAGSKTPWMYSGKEDVDRMSADLSVTDLEKLVRKISSLNKKDTVPSTCRVVPFIGTNALPQNHQTASPLPPLTEGGEVDERAIVADDTQVPSQPENEAVVSQKSTARSEKEVESEASESIESIPTAVSPNNKRKREDVEDSGTSKLDGSPVEETAPEGPQPFDAYASTLISSDEEEEEEPAATTIAPMSASLTLTVSETPRTAEETSTPHPDPQRSTPATSPRASSPKRARIELGDQFFLAGVSPTPALDDPLMQPFINLGAQFIGYRNTVEGLKESLLAANKRADDLAAKLKASEEAREKAEKDASCIEGLRKRLHEAETALTDKIIQTTANEGKIAARLESLNRRFVRKMSQDFVLEKPEDNRLLDALSLLEIHADLVRRSIFDAQTAFLRLFPYFFPKKKEPDTFAALAESFIPKEDLGLALHQENLKIGVEGTIALVAESQQNVDWTKVGEATKMKQDKWPNLIRAAKPHSKKILAFLGYKPTPSSSSAKTEVK